jgi:uncharacterized protein (TIGR03437 family)
MAQPGNLTNLRVPLSGPTVFDGAGNMYSIGGGPVTAGAAQTQSGGGLCQYSFGDIQVCPDAYVGKTGGSGNIIFGTLLGGPESDQATALAVDASQNVYVAGSTGGSFPTTANAAIGVSTTAKAFAAKLSADGSSFLYSTYLPATVASTSAIAVDAQGNAYIAGTTSAGHACVLKLSADGSAFLYNVSLAGSGQDSAAAILSDAAGNLIVAGETNSPDFPVTAAAVQRSLQGAQNAFVAKLDSGGNVAFATYLGGSGTDAASVIETDSAGNIYVAGATTSLDFPTTSGTLQPAPVLPMWNNAGPGGFVTKLSADGTTLVWSSYVMTTDHFPVQNGVSQLAVTASNEVYISGFTGPAFPVTASAPRICYNDANAEIFVAHLDSDGALLDATYLSNNANLIGGLSVSANGSVLVVWDTGFVFDTQIQFGGAGWTAPACVSPDVLNSATLSPGFGSGSTVVPGELITLTGFEIGPDTGVASAPNAQGQIPDQLAGVEVLFDGQPAPLLYVQSRQINAIAPVGISGQAQTNISVVYNQTTVGSIAAPVMSFGAPGIFRLQPGVSTQAAAINQDGTTNSPSNPAARGSVVAVWGTGFGLTDPACTTGGYNLPIAANLATGLTVYLNDGTGSVNDIGGYPPLYAGNAPALPCGVVQINFQVPSYAQPGVYRFFPWEGMAVSPGPGEQVVSGNIAVTISVK